MIQETIVKKSDRKIVERYTVGNYRVLVSTYWSSYSKSYVSTIREARLQFHGDFVTEISQLNVGFSAQGPDDDFNQEIQRVKADRYNFKQLETLQAQAVELAKATVEKLIAKGKTNSEIYKEVA